MKVVLTSLILLSAFSISACKTRYYYECCRMEHQTQYEAEQNEEGCCCDKTPSPCDINSENCTNINTYENDTDYLTPNGNPIV